MTCSDAEACEFRVRAELSADTVLAGMQHQTYPVVRAALTTRGLSESSTVRRLLVSLTSKMSESREERCVVVTLSRVSRAAFFTTVMSSGEDAHLDDSVESKFTSGHLVEIARFGISDEEAVLEIGPTSECYLTSLSQFPPDSKGRTANEWQRHKGMGWSWRDDGGVEIESFQNSAIGRFGLSEEQILSWCSLEVVLMVGDESIEVEGGAVTIAFVGPTDE